MSQPNKLLKKQMLALGLDDSKSPSLDEWQKFIKKINSNYDNFDQERYLLERSMTISSEELQDRFKKSEIKQYREKSKNEVITYITNGYILPLVLDKIIKGLEEIYPNLLCSILLLDKSKNQLVIGAAPSLPDFYNEAVSGLKIGPKAGCCGTAAYLRCRVISENIETDPLWIDYKDIAKKAHLKSCWSQPITYGEDLLGTFAIYTKEVMAFDLREDEVIQSALQLAAMAIQAKITKEKIAEQQAQFVTNAKMAALGEMASSLGHEINNPLAVVLARVFILKENIKNNLFNAEKFTSDLSVIERTANRISKIITGLKTYSRHAEQDPFEEIVLSDVINSTLEICSDKMAQDSVILKLNFENVADYFVKGRAAQLSQVVLNLMNNSRDAILNLPEKWIQLDTTIQDNKIFISITDSGHGIPKEILSKLMQPFFTTKAVGKGTGLGLSISRSIIQEHGGDLRYDETCKNTRFIIELPISETVKNELDLFKVS